MTFLPRTQDFAGAISAITHLITISHGHFDRRRGQTYNAFLGGPSGEQIVANSFAVEYDACRVLVARGLTGRLEVWRSGSTFASTIIRDVAQAALLTVREDALHGPDIVPYRSRPRVGDAARPRKQRVRTKAQAPTSAVKQPQQPKLKIHKTAASNAKMDPN
jgi:hypothetical protein